MPTGRFRGGAEEALLQLAAHHRELSFEIHVLFLERGDLVARMQTSGVACSVVEAGRLRHPLRFLGTLRMIRALIREQGVDAVLGWMTKAHIYGGLAALWCGIPALVFQMGLPDTGRVDKAAALIPCAGVLTCSEYVAQLQRAVTPHPVLAVPLAVDTARFDSATLPSAEECRQRLGLPAGQPLIGIVGRLQRWKGTHVFLAAMAQVLTTHPHALGVVVGGVHDQEPEYPGFLQGEVSRLGIVGAIRFAGAQGDVPEWMQAMDVIVHASDREPFGIVVVEAMALGKAVVAAIPGGPAEIIRHGIDGLLVESGDAPALAAAVRRCLDEPALAQACGGGALTRVEEFTAPRFARRFSAAVGTLLQKGASR